MRYAHLLLLHDLLVGATDALSRRLSTRSTVHFALTSRAKYFLNEVVILLICRDEFPAAERQMCRHERQPGWSAEQEKPGGLHD